MRAKSRPRAAATVAARPSRPARASAGTPHGKSMGQVRQVMGAVVDVQFDGHLPADPERARDPQ